MSYWIHPAAEAELGDAAVFYAQQASPLIAAAFLAEFERVVELLIDNQQRGPMATQACGSTTLIDFPTH